jgi:hypothetical protein
MGLLRRTLTSQRPGERGAFRPSGRLESPASSSSPKVRSGGGRGRRGRGLLICAQRSGGGSNPAALASSAKALSISRVGLEYSRLAKRATQALYSLLQRSAMRSSRCSSPAGLLAFFLATGGASVGTFSSPSRLSGGSDLHHVTTVFATAKRLFDCIA